MDQAKYQNLKAEFRKTLENNTTLTTEEKEFLLENIELFNESDLKQLIRNNSH